MKIVRTDPPREFEPAAGIRLKDCAHIELAPDEQVTFKADGSEYDFCRKLWGYYASPSLNSRMRRFGLRPALVKSKLNGTFFMMAVIEGKVDAFEAYLGQTRQELVFWLDDDSLLKSFSSPRVCICGGGAFEPIFHYSAPPSGETRFKFSGGEYKREIIRCLRCGHFLSVHEMKMDAIYGGEYVESTYGNGMRESFERIAALPPERSDNAGRVACITAYARRYPGFGEDRPSVLDVGSGLCVFLHRMRLEGWSATALDPDPRAVRHAEKTAQVKAICADFMQIQDLGSFDLITFNKVLEHAADPTEMLRRARRFLQIKGLVYVELPDGEAAVREGPEREEFFIEHHHIFSAASYSVLAERAGLRLLELQRLREPSGKYTLRGFLCLP